MEQVISHKIRSLYIHIPFCEKRCYYCDFVSSAQAQSEEMDAYVKRLISQLFSLSQAGLLYDIRTIYLGGGTPSYLSLANIERLLAALESTLALGRVEEFSVEANPESLDSQKLDLLRKFGVNRISLGVQSFNDKEIKAIGRIHSSKRAKEVMALLDASKINYSIDLMCGLPYQSQMSFLESLAQVEAFELSHLSVYPLTIEPGTTLDKLIDAHKVEAPSDDFEADALELAEDFLSKHGFVRYEIASYAKEGCESKHNSAYWSGISYLGLGSRAASMIYPELIESLSCALNLYVPEIQDNTARLRFSFTDDIHAYAHTDSYELYDFECLDARELVAEDLMLAFRKTEGITQAHIEKYLKRVPELQAPLMETLKECIELGLVDKISDAYVPSKKAWLLGNELFGRLWDLHESAN